MSNGHWDKVPLFAHLDGPDFGLGIADSDASSIGNRSRIVILGKWVGFVKRGSAESGILESFRQIKKANSGTQVYFPWSACDYFPRFYASMSGNRQCEDYALRIRRDGKLHTPTSGHADALLWDTSNPEMREWWVTTIADEVRREGYDGVYVDGIKQFVMRQNEAARYIGARLAHDLAAGVDEMMGKLRCALIPLGTSIIYNGAKTSPQWPDGGTRFADNGLADGVLLQSFGRNSSPSPEPAAMAADMDIVARLSRRRRIVAFTAGPDTVPESAAALEFSLACFLCCAGEDSYFRFADPGLDVRSCAIYDRELGPPESGVQLIDGKMRYARNFENATVEADLVSRTARIVWRHT
ncbi:putative glycoside hydrolase [Nocardia vinacea]|uniref:putative glycoside hydrolase n=1 Tax=Nocardia vinacea TaxID=96468 RepID=UPI0033EDE57C